eukprot:s65_g2.t1
MTIRGVNGVHFNCVLSACAKNGDWPSAFALLSQMDQLEVASDMISFSSSVQACVGWALALQLLCWAEGRRMQLDTIAMNTVLGRCAKDGRWDAALELLQRMRQHEVCQDTITYNTCISACGKASCWIEAVQLLEDMAGQSVKADGISYNAAISACADGQNWFQILKLLEEMRTGSVQKDGITYAAAISGMGDDWELALALFEHMHRESIQRDHVSYNAAMAACGWREAVALLSAHHQPDAASFGACISACEKSGEWQAAIFLLACMSAALVPMTAVTVAAAISACEKCVQWTMALQIFAEAAVTMQLDVVSYNAAIAACEKGSCWEAALTFLRRLTMTSFQPTVVTLSSVISSCAKARRWSEAMELLGKAPIWEPVACGAAMRSCVHDWTRVLQLYHQMTLALVYKDADIYSTATTACARAGQVGQVHELLTELETVALNELKREWNGNDVMYNGEVGTPNNGVSNQLGVLYSVIKLVLIGFTTRYILQ